MRLSKATWFAEVLCCAVLLASSAKAQEKEGLEALLDDISNDRSPEAAPAAEAVTTTPAQATAEPAAEAVVEPAATEAAVEVPATEPVESIIAEPTAEEAASAVDEAIVPFEESALETESEAVDVEAVPVETEAEAPVAAEEEAAAAEETATLEPEAATKEAEPAKGEAETAEAAPTVEDAKMLAAQEEVRRQAAEEQAIKNIEQGFQALNTGDFAAAEKSFDAALLNLPVRPATEEARTRAQWGYAEAHYRLAQEVLRKGGKVGDAREHLQKALKVYPVYRPAQVLMKRADRIESEMAIPKPAVDRPEFVQKEKDIQSLIKEGKQLYDIGEYDRAEAVFQQILIRDQYNVDAMRFLRRIDEKRFHLSTREREATAASMMQDVRDSWTPPITRVVEVPQDVSSRGPTAQLTGARKLQEKMSKIIIPLIEFRAANITDVINFLSKESENLDPDKIGVNILLNMGTSEGGETTTPALAGAPDLGSGLGLEDLGTEMDMGGLEGSGAEPASASSIRTITLNLRRISLLDAIKYITEVAGLKYRIEENVVIITPADWPSDKIITRMYPVQPAFRDVYI